jgi:hypothetical protein
MVRVLNLAGHVGISYLASEYACAIEVDVVAETHPLAQQARC